jgi:hypothetical protein
MYAYLSAPVNHLFRYSWQFGKSECPYSTTSRTMKPTWKSCVLPCYVGDSKSFIRFVADSIDRISWTVENQGDRRRTVAGMRLPFERNRSDEISV